jgi:polyvinyl alcohol dehydrogenase (cytochrome)
VIVTQSGVVNDNTVYVGVASYEEAYAALTPSYPSCVFRGSVLALNANTGQILWRTYTVPQG